jgi:hypothetical protein
MNSVRDAIGVVAGLILLGGYGLSQYAYFFGDPRAYAAAVDAPAFRIIAALIFIAAIALTLIRPPAEES